jgi:hypothetical protein
MPRPKCPPDENVLRAIYTAHWDGRKNRLSSSLFKGSGISVSRLAVLGMTELFEIFHKELDSPPKNRFVVGGGEINIGQLQEIGRTYEQLPTELTVEEDPTDINPAHAEIPESISKGLALVIAKALILHHDPLAPETNIPL